METRESRKKLGQGKPGFGVMYHLTGCDLATWKRDFDALAEARFRRVVLWEVNNDLERAGRALAECRTRGLRGYYVAWSPFMEARLKPWTGNRRKPDPRMFCVGMDGNTLGVCNPYLRRVRRSVLVPYLKRIARALRGQVGLSGYFIDDTLDFGEIISYTAEDAKAFRRFLKHKYGSLEFLNESWEERHRNWSEVLPPRIMLPWKTAWRRTWMDWCEARQSWWLEWADDVLAALKTGNKPEVILGDDQYSLRFDNDSTGGFTPEMVRKFDSFSFDYTAGCARRLFAVSNIDRDIAMAGDLAGGLPLTVFLPAAAMPDQPFPAARDIIAWSERCLENGVQGIDYYIYRAWPENYAFRNCLANHPRVFKELADFVRATGAASSPKEPEGR